MEFKTTQGGETTLVFDLAEENVLQKIAAAHGQPPGAIAATVTRQRQANPLASFDELVDLAFSWPNHEKYGAGVAPPKRKAAAVPPPDPNVVLEQDIRSRLSKYSSLGTTSQAMQADALLLGALATCLQTRTIAALLERLDKPAMMVVEGKRG